MSNRIKHALVSPELIAEMAINGSHNFEVSRGLRGSAAVIMSLAVKECVVKFRIRWKLSKRHCSVDCRKAPK